MDKIKQIYPDINMSPEMQELCDTINTLPGVKIICMCNGDVGVPKSIWFYSKNTVSTFILARCTDRRYWEYGSIWDITVEVGDRFKDGYLPTTYWLHPTDEELTDNEINDHMKSLTKNIENHFDDINFLSHYDIDLTEYKGQIVSYNRKLKIDKINESVYDR